MSRPRHSSAVLTCGFGLACAMVNMLLNQSSILEFVCLFIVFLEYHPCRKGRRTSVALQDTTLTDDMFFAMDLGGAKMLLINKV